MLKNISWTSYFIFMFVILIGYYITICLKYYQEEIRDILSGKSTLFSKTKFSNKLFAANNKYKLTNTELNQDDLFPLINQFTEEIKSSFVQAANNHLIKEELVYSLQQLAKKYFQIKASPYQSFITNYVLAESSNYSSIHLSEEDVNMMWVM